MNPAEAYIVNQPEPFRSILLHLQMVIEHTLKDVDLRYKWGIPCFYHGKSPLCYLNVSLKKQYVDVGFWNSAHLTKHLDKMVTEKRKVVKSLRYKTPEEIDTDVLIAVLQDAYSVKNKGFYKRGDSM
ncbi:MAG: DUF1801 domain-containing protein [Flavobacteriaceae bacterium]